MTLWRQDDVGRFQIPVYDPLLMGHLQCLGDLDTNLQRLLQGQRPLGESLLERLSLNVLHDDEVLTVVSLGHFVDVADERMIQVCCGLGLPQEPLAGNLVPLQGFGEKLEGHLPWQGGVLGQVDLPHPALAELLDDPVVGDGLVNHSVTPPEPWH